MSVPAHRRTSSAARRRRSHHALQPRQLSACQKCSQPTPAHMACQNCGTYRGRQVIAPASARTARRAKTGRQPARGKEAAAGAAA